MNSGVVLPQQLLAIVVSAGSPNSFILVTLLDFGEGSLEIKNGVPNIGTGVIHAAALAVEDHCCAGA